MARLPRKTKPPLPARVGRPIGAPSWFRPALLAVSCLLLAGLFSQEVSNSDFWWHLRTGQYIWQSHSLPDPDPFAYTTAAAGAAYGGEEVTRRLNLTHEWLAQVLIFLTHQTAGFAGIVLARAALLTAFCALAGFVAYRRCGGFYRSLAAGFAAAAVAHPFAADRPYLVTFVLLAAFLALLEWRKPAWLLLMPLLMLIWANCHGGFVSGWVVMGAYSAEALFDRLRGRPQPGDFRLWTICASTALISLVNPNSFHVVPVLLHYRASPLTASLLEWEPPALWPPTPFSLLLPAAAGVLLWAHRRVRIADWLLFGAFAAAALTASRNTILIGLLAPVLIAAYLPWKRPAGRYGEIGAAILLLSGTGAVLAGGQPFQLRAADWSYPTGAAEFLLSHHISERMFNTYEYGGYLIWRLWPFQRVFIDGRALSESVFADYRKILYTAGDRGPAGAMRLLDQYGVQVVLMNSFEYTSGQAYVLAPALADPDNGPWSLVYADAQAMIFLRHPPDGMPVLEPSQVLNAMESECELHIRHEPRFPACARNLGLMFLKNGDSPSAIRWLGVYLEHAPGKDLTAENAYQRLLQTGQ